MAAVTVQRRDVVLYRFGRQGLGHEAGTVATDDVALLDYGVQDTGTDGAAWALASLVAAGAEVQHEGLGGVVRPNRYDNVDVTRETRFGPSRQREPTDQCPSSTERIEVTARFPEG